MYVSGFSAYWMSVTNPRRIGEGISGCGEYRDGLGWFEEESSSEKSEARRSVTFCNALDKQIHWAFTGFFDKDDGGLQSGSYILTCIWVGTTGKCCISRGLLIKVG